mgnify:CR=1 FL=1
MQGSSTHAVALNPIGAQTGQKVVVESSNKRLYGVMLLVYAVPIVLFLIGYFASYALTSEGENFLDGLDAAWNELAATVGHLKSK